MSTLARSISLTIAVLVTILLLLAWPATLHQGVRAQVPYEGFPPERRIPVDKVLPHPGAMPGIPLVTYGLTDCMDGDVLVRAVFVDSDGSIDANLYSWNNPSDPGNPYGTQEVDTYMQRIRSQYDFSWSIWAPRYSKQVKFYVEKNVVAVPYEPILHASGDGVWERSALSTLLGIPVYDEFSGARQWAQNGLTVNQFGRSFNRSTVIFFVLNTSASQNFADGSTSFAYIGGPYGAVRRFDTFIFEDTTIHETGHLFWALDEYASWCSAHGGCSSDWWWDRDCLFDHTPVTNGNCESCNPGSVVCMMKYGSPTVCAYTAHQISWNGTALSSPVITNVKCPGCTSGGKLLVKGIGLDSTCSVFIDRVEYAAIYRSDTDDLAVKELYLQTATTYEFRVKRSGDGLVSDPYIKSF